MIRSCIDTRAQVGQIGHIEFVIALTTAGTNGAYFPKAGLSNGRLLSDSTRQSIGPFKIRTRVGIRGTEFHLHKLRRTVGTTLNFYLAVIVGRGKIFLGNAFIARRMRFKSVVTSGRQGNLRGISGRPETIIAQIIEPVDPVGICRNHSRQGLRRFAVGHTR